MKEKSKFDKLKKEIGVGILAGTLGLANVSGSNDSMNLDDSEQGTKIKNSILLDKPINLNLKDGISLEDNKVPNKKFFEKRISEMEVDDSLKPILVDILMRRSLEYELNKEEIERDLNRLNNNVEEIIVDDNKGKDWGGLHNNFEKTIRIGSSYLELLNKENKEYFQNMLYETLTHEIYHALSYDENNGKSNLEGEKWETSRPLHEIIVEKAADRAALKKQNDKYVLPYEVNRTGGYSESTFITDIIEAIYGMSEKEFLSSAIKGGKENLIRTMANKVNENPKETQKFMNDIETPFNVQFYSMYYKESNMAKPEDAKKAMADIYKVSIKKMNNLIQNKKIDNLEDAKEYVENLKYNYAKLNDVMKYSLIQPSLKETMNSQMYKDVIPDKSALENRIHNMNEILKCSDQINSKELILEVFNEAKANQISDKNLKIIEKQIEKNNKEKMERNNKKDYKNQTKDLIIEIKEYDEYNYNNKLNITNCKYWEDRNENKFWDIPMEYKFSEMRETYQKTDFHKEWDNKEIGDKMEKDYRTLYDEHKNGGILKSVKDFIREKKANARYNWNRLKMFVSNIKNKLPGKKEPLMLNSGEEKHVKTIEDQKKEFMDEIKVDLVKMKSLKDEKSMSTIDKNKEKKEEIERTI